MPSDGLTDVVRQFLFESIDSVEQLEVLLLLRSQRERAWSVQDVTQELRGNATSVANRLASLESLELVGKVDGSPPVYRYGPKSPADEALGDALAEAYKTRRHTVLEIIFSPAKRVRRFADAFKMRGKGRNEGDDG